VTIPNPRLANFNPTLSSVCGRGVWPAHAQLMMPRHGSIRAWGDGGSAKLPLACKPSELARKNHAKVAAMRVLRARGLASSSGKEPTSLLRCTTDTRAELNWSNLHAGRVCSRTPRRSLVAVFLAISATYFAGGNLSTGTREDRGNRGSPG